MREPVPLNFSACLLTGARCQLCPLSPGAPGPAAAEGAGGQLQQAPGLPQGQDHPGTLWLPVSSFQRWWRVGDGCPRVWCAVGTILACPGTASPICLPFLGTCLLGQDRARAGCPLPHPVAWVVGSPHSPCLSFPTAVLPLSSLLMLPGCSQPMCLHWGVVEMDRQAESSEPAQLQGWGILHLTSYALLPPQAAAVGG